MTVRKRRYRGASAEQRRAERRRQLLAAGIAVFGDVGFQTATIKQLCAAAGLTERYFYESFPNREALFEAVYDAKLDELKAQIIAALDTAEAEPSAIARAGLTAFFAALERDRRMARILLIEIYRAHYDPDKLYRRSVQDFARLVEGFAGPLLGTAADPRVDAGLLATGLVGVCIQMALRWAIEGYRQPSAQLVANALLIFEGLQAQLGA